MDLLHLTADNIDSSHAWFSRLGGVSPAPFDSLNVSQNVGDKPENVIINRRRCLESLKLDPAKLIFAGELAHSDKVCSATAKDAGKDLAGYDAIITNVADLPIGLSTADCLSIFMESTSPKAIAVVHVGWRGLQAGIIGNVVQLLEQTYGVDPSHLTAAIGPSIGPKSYQVGPEVVSHFDDDLVNRSEDTAYLDLWRGAERQLDEAGVMTVDNLEIDTFRDKHFFSFRREESKTGRQLAVISL